MITFREPIRRALAAQCRLNLQPFLSPALVSANKVTRPAWSRLNQILDRLMGGVKFTATTLAAEFRTTTKTINRDLAYLRGRGFKIVFNKQTWSYQLNGGNQ